MAGVERLGIFGGTFDPPHVAHAILASEACAQLGLDRVLWVLTADPPHKLGRVISPLEDRLALLQAALAGDAAFELSRVDIDRPPPHYAVGTLQHLRQQYPGHELVYLLGGDSLRDLPTWHAPREFVSAVDGIGVMRRPGAVFDLDALEAQLPGLGAKLRFMDVPLMEISATEIRRRAAADQPFRYYLLPAVWETVRKRGLYGIPQPG